MIVVPGTEKLVSPRGSEDQFRFVGHFGQACGIPVRSVLKLDRRKASRVFEPPPDADPFVAVGQEQQQVVAAPADNDILLPDALTHANDVAVVRRLIQTQLIPTVAARKINDIVAGATADVIIAGSAGQGIVAPSSVQLIVTRQTMNHLPGLGTIDLVVTCRADDFADRRRPHFRQRRRIPDRAIAELDPQTARSDFEPVLQGDPIARRLAFAAIATRGTQIDDQALAAFLGGKNGHVSGRDICGKAQCVDLVFAIARKDQCVTAIAARIEINVVAGATIKPV